MKQDILLNIDANLKGIDIQLKGAIFTPNDFSDLSVSSVKGAFPNFKENLEDLLKEDVDEDLEKQGGFYNNLSPFIPEQVALGYYKITKQTVDNTKKVAVNPYQFVADYESFKLQGVFAKEIKLFSTSLKNEIPLKGLPLVGQYLQNHSISKLEIVYLSNSVKEQEIDAVLNYIKQEFVDKSIWLDNKRLALQESINVGTVLKKGSETFKTTYPLQLKPEHKVESKPIHSKEDGSQNDGNNNSPTKPTDKKKPLVQINEIKPSISGENIAVTISADFNIGPFGVQLIGLGIEFPIDALKTGDIENLLHSIKYKLEGLGLTYTTPSIAINGVFMKTTDGDNDVYNGLLSIKLAKTEIIAIGSYIKTPQFSSLFAFGYLGVNIPLHPAINITGLGLGFGMNMNFKMPEISKIEKFPIISIVNNPKEWDKRNTKDKLSKVSQLFKDLNYCIKPEDGTNIIMGAVKFNSFKTIETTAIVAINFGNKLNINLLGVSNFSKPKAYNIELAFSVLVDMDNGIFMARGELTNQSYILSPKIKLSGGFAFGMWFKDKLAGDFVMSIGGYHPDFSIPDHYPRKIPRIAVDFSIGKVDISGKAYFAMTPASMMAGLDIELTYNIRKWLFSADIYINLVADFLINWAPFQYDAKIRCEIYVNITIGRGFLSVDLEFDFTAQLHIYGPDLGGDGYFEVADYEIPFRFGQSCNNQKASLSFKEYKKQYFSDEDKILTYNIASGIIKKFKNEKGEETIVVNPKTFALEINSEIPISNISKSDLQLNDSPRTDILPVCSDFEKFENTLKLSISGTRSDFSSFNGSLIKQAVPKAIWNTFNKSSKKDKLSNDNLLKDVCKGIRLEFKQQNPKPSSVTFSLYDTLVKEYTNEVSSVSIMPDLIKYKNINTTTMSAFGILTEDVIDTTDLKSTIDVYKYKSQSLGTYKVA